MDTPRRVDRSPPAIFVNWSSLANLIRLRNQSGTLLLLWPSLWSLWLASHGRPSWWLIVIFVAGAFLMRSAGVIMNDLADRRIDRQVARTQSRPLASGELRTSAALVTLACLLAVSAGLLTLLPPLAWALSPVALALAAGYPLAKRVLALPQAILGMAFGWGAVMAWASVRQQLEPATWAVFCGTVCWAIAYDTIYAMQDRDDDRRIGIHSSALFFGRSAWVAVLVCEAGFLACLAAAGCLTGSGPSFYAVLLGVGVFLTRQALRVRSITHADEAFALFTQHVWVGLVVLIGIATGFA